MYYQLSYLPSPELGVFTAYIVLPVLEDVSSSQCPQLQGKWLESLHVQLLCLVNKAKW